MKRIAKMITISIFVTFIFSGCNNKEGEEEFINTLNLVNGELNKEISIDYSGDISILNKRVIVIDPGHSSNPSEGSEPNAPGSDVFKPKDSGGATGINGMKEYELTQAIGNLLKDNLEKKGYKVIMTKDEVGTSISNVERAEVGNNSKGALVIRLHADSFDNSSAEGATMVIPDKSSSYTSNISDDSRVYGETILKTYTSMSPIKSRGISMRKDMTGFNWSKVPVVILEMGFLSNVHDDSYLSNRDNHKAIANAIGEGIDKCFVK